MTHTVSLPPVAPSGTYRVLVTDPSVSPVDSSAIALSPPFTVLGSPYTFSAPSFLQSIPIGSSFQVSWSVHGSAAQSTGTGSALQLELWTGYHPTAVDTQAQPDAGSTLPTGARRRLMVLSSTLVQSAPGAGGQFSWRVPALPSLAASGPFWLRLRAADAPRFADVEGWSPLFRLVENGALPPPPLNLRVRRRVASGAAVVGWTCLFTPRDPPPAAFAIRSAVARSFVGATAHAVPASAARLRLVRAGIPAHPAFPHVANATAAVAQQLTFPTTAAAHASAVAAAAEWAGMGSAAAWNDTAVTVTIVDYEATVEGVTDLPAYFSVQPLNGRGQGRPATALGVAVAPRCGCGQYLSTERRVEYQVCTDCPEGARCEREGLTFHDLVAKPGYWAADAVTEDRGLDFLPCPRPSACLGGNATTRSRCASDKGYSGQSCMVCRDDLATPYVSKENYCKPCYDATLNWIVFLLSFMGLLYLLRLAARLRARRRWMALGLLRMLFNYSSTLSLLGEFRLRGSPVFQDFATLLKTAVSGPDVGAWPMACAGKDVGWRFYGQFLFYELLPILCYMFSVASTAANASDVLKEERAAQEEAVASGELDASMAFPPEKRRGTYMAAALAVAVLFHTSLSTNLFDAFHCSDPIDGTSYLLADWGVVCGDNRHTGIRAVAGLSLLLVAVFPLWLLFVVFRESDNLLTSECMDKYGMLYAGYDPYRFPWWEVMVVARKLAMKGCAMLSNHDPFVSVFLSCWVLLFSLLAHMWFHPYATRALNRLETAILLVLYLTQGCNILYWDASSFRVPFTFLQYALNFALLGYFALFALGKRLHVTSWGRRAEQLFNLLLPDGGSAKTLPVAAARAARADAAAEAAEAARHYDAHPRVAGGADAEDNELFHDGESAARNYDEYGVTSGSVYDTHSTYDHVGSSGGSGSGGGSGGGPRGSTAHEAEVVAHAHHGWDMARAGAHMVESYAEAHGRERTAAHFLNSHDRFHADDGDTTQHYGSEVPEGYEAPLSSGTHRMSVSSESISALRQEFAREQKMYSNQLQLDRERQRQKMRKKVTERRIQRQQTRRAQAQAAAAEAAAGGGDAAAPAPEASIAE